MFDGVFLGAAKETIYGNVKIVYITYIWDNNLSGMLYCGTKGERRGKKGARGFSGNAYNCFSVEVFGGGHSKL